MNINKIIFLICLTILVAACDKEEPLVEENPTTEIIETPEHEFYIRGTINGEPIAFEHLSSKDYNTPFNSSDPSSNRLHFGTIFTKKDVDNSAQYFDFRISKNGTDSFLDVVKIGTFEWFDFAASNTASGLAYVNQLNWEGQDYSSVLTTASVDYNEFNITSVELLENDDSLEDQYKDRLYKVQGNFKLMLHIWDNNFDNDTTKLIIDEFSAIFYDDTP